MQSVDLWTLFVVVSLNYVQITLKGVQITLMT